MQAHPFAGGLVLAPPEPAPLLILNAAAGRAWRGSQASPEIEPAPPPTSAPSLAPPARPGPDRSLRRVYALCGRPIAVQFAPASLESYVARRFEHSRDDDAEPVATLTVTRTEAGYVLGTPHRALSLRSETALLGAFVREFVELSHPRTGWRMVAHAAAVACNGLAVLLPGPNGSGKSTLVAGLLAAGCGYLSDDCAPISREGRVIPVPFALCLKSGSWSVAAPYLPGLAAAPVVAGPGSRRCRFVPARTVVATGVAPRLLIFPRYAAGAGLELRTLDPVETLTRLVEARAWLSRNPPDLGAGLAMIERLPSFALDYGDLNRAVATVLELSADAEPRNAGQLSAG